MIVCSDILLSHFCDSCLVVADVHGNLSERSEHGLPGRRQKQRIFIRSQETKSRQHKAGYFNGLDISIRTNVCK